MEEGRVDEQRVKQAWHKVQEVVGEAAEAIKHSQASQVSRDNSLRIFIAIRELKDACHGDLNVLKNYDVSPDIQALALEKQNDYFYMNLYPAAEGFKKHAESFTKKQTAEKTEFEDISKWAKAVFDKVFEPLVSAVENRGNVSIQAQDSDAHKQYQEAYNTLVYYRDIVADPKGAPDVSFAKEYQQLGRTTQETILAPKRKFREVAKEKVERTQQKMEELKEDVRERLAETKSALKGKLKRSSAPSESIALTREEIDAVRFRPFALSGNEITAVSGTYREIYTAFGLDMLIDTKTQDVNLDAIAKDIARTPFLSQHPGDFERFADLWINFNSSCYGQGDVKGSELAAVQNDMVPMKYGKAEDMAAIRETTHESSFGYLDEESGNPSGISCYVARDPNDPTFHYWIISIMHNATDSPDERQMHVITNLPARAPLEPIFQQGSLDSHKIEDRKELLAFLKESVHSAPVYSLLEHSLNEDCTFKEESNQTEFFTQEALQQVGYSQHDLMIVSPEGVGDYSPTQAKADAEKKLAELRQEPHVVPNVVDEAILSLWKNVLNEMKLADKNKIDYLPLLLAAEKLLRAINSDGRASTHEIGEMLTQLAAAANLSEEDVSHTFCYDMSNMLAGIQQTLMFPNLDKVIHAVKPFTALDPNQMARYSRDAENNANIEPAEKYARLIQLMKLADESPRKFNQTLKTYSLRDLADYIEAYPETAEKILKNNPVLLARFMGDYDAISRVFAVRPDVVKLCADPFTVSMDNGFANVKAAYGHLRKLEIDDIATLFMNHPDSGLVDIILKKRRGTKLPWRSRNFRQEICEEPGLLQRLIIGPREIFEAVAREGLLDSHHIPEAVRADLKAQYAGREKLWEFHDVIEDVIKNPGNAKALFISEDFVEKLMNYSLQNESMGLLEPEDNDRSNAFESPGDFLMRILQHPQLREIARDTDLVERIRDKAKVFEQEDDALKEYLQDAAKILVSHSPADEARAPELTEIKAASAELDTELAELEQQIAAASQQIAALDREMKGIMDSAEADLLPKQECRAVLATMATDKLRVVLLDVFDHAKNIGEYPTPEKMQQFVDKVQKVEDYAGFKALLIESDGMFLRLFNDIPKDKIEVALKSKVEDIHAKAPEMESPKEVSKEQYRIK